MITPSPTTKLAPSLARGTLVATLDATSTLPERIVFAVPNTSYELHLIPQGPITAQPGKRLIGTIRAHARSIDLVQTGGRYIEPVAGKPRRIQGTVAAAAPDSLLIDAPVPLHITPPDPRQKPGDFNPGDLVAFDLPDWPTFTQA